VLADLADFVGRTAFFVGDIDPKLSWVAKRLLKPGSIAFDVGANIGMMTMLYAKLVGPSGRVHSFEPNPAVMHSLAAAVARAKYENVQLNEAALSAATGTFTLKAPMGNLGSASLIREMSDQSNYLEYSVQVGTLDDYVWKQSVRSIDLIKIDVEGAELDVLLGAKRTLAEIRPQAILFEDNSSSTASESPVIEFLRTEDYEVLSIPKALFRMRVKPCAPSDIGHDYIAAKRGAQFDRLCKLIT
jgi:FkbM family methyltransferase